MKLFSHKPNHKRSPSNPTLKTWAKRIGAAVLLTSALQQSATAGETTFFGEKATGKWIIGLKAGKVDPNINNVKNAETVGVVLGYEFSRAIGINGGSSTIELEYLSADDTIDNFDTSFTQDFLLENNFSRDFLNNNTLRAGSYEADVLNLFFTYRSPGTVYYKLKAGLSYATVDVNVGARDELDREDVSIAGGFGVGYRVSDLGVIELEYSADTGESDLSVVAVNALLEF